MDTQLLNYKTLKPKLIIVSIDGTIRSNFFSEYSWPFEVAGLAIKRWAQESGATIVLIANAGGVGCRVGLEAMDAKDRWTDPSNYPDRATAEKEVEDLSMQVFGEVHPASLAFKYHKQNRKTGEVWGEVYIPKEYRGLPEWSDAWRLPDCGMIDYWRTEFALDEVDCVVIGSSINDLNAAQRANVRFFHVMALIDQIYGERQKEIDNAESIAY